MTRQLTRCWVLLLLLGITGPGCATNKVAKDLAGYVNQGVLRIAELERVSLEKYAAVTGPNYRSDRKIYETLRDEVLPLYKRFLQGLRDLRPETREVIDLHGIYIVGAESLYEGFREKMAGIAQGDENIIRAANAKIEKGRLENERWRNELLALGEKHGLRVDKKEQQKGDTPHAGCRL
ncbi:MAG: hypothetical protein JXL84_07695 [Deltaproteobacteria bacterium]|nr:hypothetical protein [Deltaproteobacteria bacterium]